MVIEDENRRAGWETEPRDLAERVRERLRRLEELPSSAVTLQRALLMLDEPICTNLRLERVLSSDQGAVLGLLRIANSAYFGIRGEVASVATAIRVVGHRRLRALLCHLIAGKLLEILRLDAPEVDRVRRKALAAAVVCAQAAEVAGDADELRVAGLLHNIGELALASEFPRELMRSVDPLEKLGLGFEAAGAMLLRSWRLPAALADAALHWRVPQTDETLRASQRTIDMVHVGATLAEAWIENATPVSAAARVDDEVLRRLELSETRLAALFDKIPSGIQKIEAIL